MRVILDDPNYQRELPEDPSPPHSSIASLLLILGWIMLFAVVAALACWLGIVLANRRRRPLAGRETEEVSGTTEKAAPAPPDHALLAREDRFVDAIHALLLHALAALGRDAALAPADTSREILRDAALQTEARAALSGLVLAVELSLFGGRETGEREYRASLAGYENFQKAVAGTDR